MNLIKQTRRAGIHLLFLLTISSNSLGVIYEIHPANTGSQEEFETIANSLRPGDHRQFTQARRRVNPVRRNLFTNCQARRYCQRNSRQAHHN
ncbi:MAG: hypothetical protein ACYS3S_20710 [Planctomycetota bacterium]